MRPDQFQRGPDLAVIDTEPKLPLVASFQSGREAVPLSQFMLRKRFLTACSVLGKERLVSLTVHYGWQTFISHALAGGCTPAEVRDVAAHANVAVTSGYLHVAVDDQEPVGLPFG